MKQLILKIFLCKSRETLRWFSFIQVDLGFDLTTRDSYFTILVEVFTNHILAENMIDFRIYFTIHLGWTEHKIMVLKPANKNKIIRQHNFENIYQQFLSQPHFLSSKGFVNIIFYGVKNNEMIRREN